MAFYHRFSLTLFCNDYQKDHYFGKMLLLMDFMSYFLIREQGQADVSFAKANGHSRA
jgi:hypothetical protein